MASRQRVFLHVGLPKTGTSFLQGALFGARAQLTETGVSYPASHYDDHFFAALDLQDLAFNETPRPQAAGRWADLSARVRDWPGTSVVSSEVLAAATPEQAGRAVETLAPAQVHVVLTVRELGAHLVSTWQEDVKHGEVAGFTEWLAAITARDESRWNRAWYWRAADLPSVLSRWAAVVPPERTHVITVPSSDRNTLWHRFSGVVGIDPAGGRPPSAGWSNAGLGADATRLLRWVNTHRDERLDQVEYEHLVKGLLAHETLSRYPDPVAPRLPAQAQPLVRERSAEWLAVLRTSGVDVVGALDELAGAEVPLERAGARPAVEPDAVADADVLDVAGYAVWELLVRVRDARRRLTDLGSHLEAERSARETAEALAQRSGPVRRLVRRASRRSPAVMRARVVWWHTVERLRDR